GFNAHDNRVSTFDSMTEATSHELAEAVTDPLTYGQGRYDNRYGLRGEIGGLAAGQIVRLNRYGGQKEAGKHGHPLSPAGAPTACGYAALGASGSVAAALQAPTFQAFAGLLQGKAGAPLPEPKTASDAVVHQAAPDPLDVLFRTEFPFESLGP